MTIYKTQKRVKRQLRFGKSVAKGVFVARKALFATYFQSMQCVGGCMWQSCVGVSRKLLALTINKAKISFVNIPIRQQMYRRKTQANGAKTLPLKCVRKFVEVKNQTNRQSHKLLQLVRFVAHCNKTTERIFNFSLSVA